MPKWKKSSLPVAKIRRTPKPPNHPRTDLRYSIKLLVLHSSAYRYSLKHFRSIVSRCNVHGHAPACNQRAPAGCPAPYGHWHSPCPLPAPRRRSKHTSKHPTPLELISSRTVIGVQFHVHVAHRPYTQPLAIHAIGALIQQHQLRPQLLTLGK